MTKLFTALLKRHFYILGLANFAFFMMLAFSYQSGLAKNLTSLFIGTETLTEEEQALYDKVNSWQENIVSLKSYIDGAEYTADQKATRSNKYNNFSTRNNSLMTQALLSPQAKKAAVHNALAKRSLNYADYFEAVKTFIASGKPVQVTLLVEPMDLFKKNVGESKFNNDSIFLSISLASLTLAILHLLVLYRGTRKENITLNSQVDTFKKVISNMSEGVIVTDKYGFFTFTNESAKNIIGPVVNDIFYSSSIEVMGFQTTDGRKLTKEELPMFTALKKGMVNEQEFVIKNPLHPDGIFVSCSNGYYVDDRGLTSGSVVVLKNITAKKQMEQFWKSEQERATEHSKLKSDFLASMSHEIRTPMNAVLGLTTLLKETKLNTDQKDYVVTIQRSAKSLLTLINDILDHSKIEAGKLDITNSPFSLKALAHEIADNFKPMVMEKNIELKLNFSELKQETFNSDANRIRQIMINLMGNAIKFTKEGSVELQFITDNKNTKIIVKDTGSGMTPVEVSHLFQKYFQTKNGQTVGGTGLGLNICKQLVDLLKGEIGVTSELGKGTQFWFSLPLEHCNMATPDVSEMDAESLLFTNQFQGLVLVAEDSTVNQKVITNYLSKLGLQSVIANNGEEAVKMYQSHHPDLILMDSNMPVMNGLEATKKIVELQHKNPNFKKTPIVGLSADVRQTNFDNNLQAGMAAFLTKPIELNKLVALLKQYFTASIATASQIEKIKHLTVGDQLLIEILLQDFTAQAPAQIAEMTELLAAKNLNGLFQVAHGLKSAAAELDAHELHQILGHIEQLADENDPNNYDSLSNLIDKAQLSFTLAIAGIVERIDDIKASQRKAA
ncbi:histidine kinase [Bdellovibrio sp. qaytius]|nr:histidine kinase [Bdellovibrio sp. qaytius]